MVTSERDGQTREEARSDLHLGMAEVARAASCHFLQRPAERLGQLAAELQAVAVLPEDLHLRQPLLELWRGPEAKHPAYIKGVVEGGGLVVEPYVVRARAAHDA